MMTRTAALVVALGLLALGAGVMTAAQGGSAMTTDAPRAPQQVGGPFREDPPPSELPAGKTITSQSITLPPGMTVEEYMRQRIASLPVRRVVGHDEQGRVILGPEEPPR